MDIYNYDASTGELLNQSAARQDPLDEGKFLIPAHATTVAPPSAGSHQRAVFAPAAKTWSLVPDYRGADAWSTSTGAKTAVTTLGKSLADLGLTDQQPPAYPAKWSGSAWVADLDTARANKVAELSAACQAAIYAGYDSDALDSTHHYPAQDHDQRNMIASVTASLLPGLPADWTTPFWCADSAGAWAMRDHTAAQIQQAAEDGTKAILTLMAKNVQLAGEAQAAADIDAVNAVTWF